MLTGREMTACPVRGAVVPLCIQVPPCCHTDTENGPCSGENRTGPFTPGQKELPLKSEDLPSSAGLPSSGPPGLSGGCAASEVLDLNSGFLRSQGSCLGAAEADHRMATEECNGI